MPITAPRSLGATPCTARVMTAGVSKATPVAKTAVPATSPAGVRQAPTIASPAADRARAIRVARAGPSRSGIQAPTPRIPTTTAAKSSRTTREPPIPRSRAYRGTKVRNPAMPRMPASSTSPGSRPARWTRRRPAAGPPGSGAGSWGRVSGTSTATATAASPAAPARAQAAPNPDRSMATSPSSGPTPMPTYRASEARLMASPRRWAGARSATAVSAPTKKHASPAPVSSRRPARASGLDAVP